MTSSIPQAGAKPKLRVGLLVDSLRQPRWIARIVEEISRSSYAEVVLVVHNAQKCRQSRWAQLAAKRRHILRKLYTELDDRLFRGGHDPFAAADIAPLVGGCQTISVTPRQTLHCDYFSAEEVEAIRRHRLDVAFRFGFRILKGDALRIARFGVWSYHHGEPATNRGGPAGFWEVMEGNPVTGTLLQVLTPDLDAGKVLGRSWASTYKYSVRRNKQNLYWKSPGLALRALKNLYDGGPAAIEDKPESRLYQPYSNRLYKPPTNSEMAGLLLKFGLRASKRALRSCFYQGQWLIAYKLDHAERIATRFYDFRLLVPPKDRFWADPFPVERSGRYFIFVEELLYATGKGHISVMEMMPNGEWSEPVKALEKEHHLSHPFLFDWDGRTFMIPETNAAQRCELYCCRRFPDQWELETTILEGIRASDATIARIEGTWWLFANVFTEGVSSNDELHAFYADRPTGPWQPHPANPVKSDVRSARPAGALFRWNGELYRPAQNSSRDYGYSIVLNRICRLTPTEYEEETVSELLPHWHPRVRRNHTLNHAGRLTVVDAYWHRRRLF
jgi:hypothetical protein